jgi:hypothetical protein
VEAFVGLRNFLTPKSVPNAMTISVGDELIGVARLDRSSITEREARETYAVITAAFRECDERFKPLP